MAEPTAPEDDVNIDVTEQDLAAQPQATTQATAAAKARAQRLGLPVKGSEAATTSAVAPPKQLSQEELKSREDARKKRFGTETPADKAAARQQRFAPNNTESAPSTNGSAQKTTSDKEKSRIQRFGLPLKAGTSEADNDKKRKRELRFQSNLDDQEAKRQKREERFAPVKAGK